MTMPRRFLPAAAIDKVTESGRPVTEQDGIESCSVEGDLVILKVRAGSYSFRCEYAGRK